VAGAAVSSLAVAVPLATAQVLHPGNQQVALVNGTDEQLPYKSSLNGTAQVTSHDGRYVVFSTAAPLVASDDNDLDDVYLRDTADGITVLVSERNGFEGNDFSFEPTISADGRYVAFTTWATNLVAHDRNESVLDVLVRDMQTGRIRKVSVTSGERQRNANSFFPVISDDGNAVSFQTFGRFGPRDSDRKEDVYVRYLGRGVTRQASLLPGSDRDVRGPVLNGDISGNGRVVVFGNANHLWARNIRSGETIRFHHEPDSPPCQPFPSGSAGRPAISGDGRFAAFASCATDLPGEDGQHADVYRINLDTGRIKRVHRAGGGNSYLPSLSRTGRFVGFGSEADDLIVRDDEALGPDAFVVDMRHRDIRRVSDGYDGSHSNGPSASTDVAISGNGRVLAYVSYADNLVPGDEHDFSEVFVWHQ
jgi:Tol biopolymer transport system component